VALLVGVASIVEADVSGIEILSQEYHVWGQIVAEGNGEIVDSYDEQGNSALSEATAIPYGYADSSAALFDVASGSQAGGGVSSKLSSDRLGCSRRSARSLRILD
jgi:hypothetical protein